MKQASDSSEEIGMKFIGIMGLNEDSDKIRKLFKEHGVQIFSETEITGHTLCALEKYGWWQSSDIPAYSRLHSFSCKHMNMRTYISHTRIANLLRERVNAFIYSGTGDGNSTTCQPMHEKKNRHFKKDS